MIGGKKATDYGPAVDRAKNLEAQGLEPLDIALQTERELGVRAVKDDDGEYKIEIPTSSFQGESNGTFLNIDDNLGYKFIRNERRVVDPDLLTKYTKLMLSDVLPPDAFRPGYIPSKFAKTPFRTENLQIIPDIYQQTKSGNYKLVQQSPFRTKKGSEEETIFHIQHNKIAGSNKTIMRAEGRLTYDQKQALPEDLRARLKELKNTYKIPTITNIAKTQEDLIRLGAPRLSEVLDYPQLYKQYPELANIPILRGENKKTMLEQGYYGLASYLGSDKDERYIVINDHASSEESPPAKTLMRIVRTLVHEAEHIIQEKEGMTPGGDPSAVNLQISRFVGDNFFKKLPRTLRNNIGFSLYKALGGEVDARLVEARLKNPVSQHKETFTQTRAGEAIGFPFRERTTGRPEEGAFGLDMTNYRDLLVVRDLIKQLEDKYLEDLALLEGDNTYIAELKKKEGKYYKKPYEVKTLTEKFEEKIKEGLEKGTIRKPAQQDMFPEKFKDGGVAGLASMAQNMFTN
jgi:hypothetical protein